MEVHPKGRVKYVRICRESEMNEDCQERCIVSKSLPGNK